jgi:hypothetical protein
MSTAAAALPAPLVKPLRHPIKWLRQRVGLVLTLVIGAHIGTLIIAALYYLLFETYHPFTVEWHNAVPNSDLRHAIRNVGEGLLGGVLGQMLIYNAFKRSSLKTKMGILDKIEYFLHLPNRKDDRDLAVWQVLLAPLIIVLYAVPGFVVGFWVADGLHHGLTFAGQVVQANYPHEANNYFQTVVTSDWDQKVIGIFASVFLGRRPIKVYAHDTQAWFAQRRVLLGKPLRFYHTPVFKARYNYLKANANAEQSVMAQGGWQAKVMVGLVAVGVALTGFGFYVLNYIAK